MTIYYLYIKTHKITGLKYLGQTKRNPHTYRGSGKDWAEHLRLHGNNVETELLFQSANKNEMTQLGRYYSTLLNIVGAADNYGNKIWANRIPETGGGSGSRLTGVPRSAATKQKIRSGMPDQSGKNNNFYGKKHTAETRKKCGLANLGVNNKSVEGAESISKSMKERWNNTSTRENQIQALKSRKGEKRSKSAIESYKKAAKERNAKMSSEERIARSLKAAETMKKNNQGLKRKRYVDEQGKIKYLWVSIMSSIE
jgi:hypothetical protein